MRHLLPIRSLAAVVLGCALAACGGDDGDGTPPIDAATIDVSTIDADPNAINTCLPQTATDLTDPGATRTIATQGQSYTPNCIRIKVGQRVTWTSNFTTHPLSSGTPETGPEAGSPIPLTTNGFSQTVTFPAAGGFGFYCQEHPATMRGAVFVEP